MGRFGGFVYFFGALLNGFLEMICFLGSNKIKGLRGCGSFDIVGKSMFGGRNEWCLWFQIGLEEREAYAFGVRKTGLKTSRKGPSFEEISQQLTQTSVFFICLRLFPNT